MNFDLTRLITNKFSEISESLNLKKDETNLILDIQDKIGIIGIQFDKKERIEKEKNKIIKQISYLKKFIKLNHIIINSRSIIIQFEEK